MPRTPMRNVLVVDDDPKELRHIADLVTALGYRPVPAPGGEAALDLLRGGAPFLAILLDLVMPDLDGMGVMDRLVREGIPVPVILTGVPSGLEGAELAIRRGAIEALPTPFSPERLLLALAQAARLSGLERQLALDLPRRAGTPALRDMVAAAPEMVRAVAVLAKAARSPLPLLIEGEAGTGKHLAARIVHALGERSPRPFVSLDCSVVPAGRVEAALFGSDGEPARPGKLAQAHGGTLFLREPADLPPAAQETLLRWIESGAIPRAGRGPEPVHARLIVASRRRLLDLAKAGELREDLFYRLNVLPAFLPPLRERAEDLPALAGQFLLRAAAEAGRRVLGLSLPALELLGRHRWPGNVRELEAQIWRAVSLAEFEVLEPADFPGIMAAIEGRRAALLAPPPLEEPRPRPRSQADVGVPDRFLDESGRLRSAAAIERAHIAFAIEHHGGHMSHVARSLAIGRSTLYRKLAEYDLEPGTPPFPHKGPFSPRSAALPQS